MAECLANPRLFLDLEPVMPKPWWNLIMHYYPCTNTLTQGSKKKIKLAGMI